MTKLVFKILCFFILISLSWSGLAQNTDKVFLKNGDVITGEIKKLKYAKLTFDLDGPGLIDIKWEEIIKVTSNRTFQVTLKNGDVLITTFDELYLNKNLVLDDIVEMVQIKNKFFQRLEGDISLGFSYNKSNNTANFNFNNTFIYRRPKTEVDLKLNSVISKNKNDSITAKKQDASFIYTKDFKNNYIFISSLGWEQNTQLGLANRFLLKGGPGKNIIKTNRQLLLTAIGLSYNQEQSASSIEYVGNLESLIIIQFKEFKYTTPKLSIDASYVILPGLSQWGRVRMDFQLNMKYEIFKHFNVGVSFYDLYDNRPPEGAVSKNDFGVNTTIGYYFGK